MTEPGAHFESEVQKVAREKNGGAVTAELFWDITVALGKDLKAVDAAGQARHLETLGLLAAHTESDSEHEHAAAKWQAEECARKHAELFARAPRRADDPAAADYAHGEGRVAPETPKEALISRAKFSREQIVASFWILVGLLVLSNVIPRIIDGVVHLIEGH